jgi:hypothetical protein
VRRRKGEEYNSLRRIDASFGRLIKLETLELTDNELRAVPAELGGIDSLCRLKLGANPIFQIPRCSCCATDLLRQIDAMPLTNVLAAHTASWAALWRRGMRVSMMGLNEVIRASTYALLSSMREDWPYSTSPGGISTNGYNGHAFWDMETWMMPSLLLFYPEIARGSPMKYRQLRLAGAKAKAASLG